MYSDDNREYYPMYANWAAWGGKKGLKARVDNLHGSLVNQTNRPLNVYTKNVEVYHCPSDKGDALWANLNPPVLNCFEDWGNSYLMVWRSDLYGVKWVGGNDGNMVSPIVPSIKATEIARKASSKIILGDWPWFPDRNIFDPKSAWHNDKGKSVFPILFGDGHVKFFTFPTNILSMRRQTPSPDFTWW